jgi:hypothetical protein
MSIQARIDELQATLDRLRAEAVFTADRTPFQSGAEHFADQVELVIARRLELLDNWAPPLAGGIRKSELHQIRESIRKITTP